jgi:uncharacterized protein YndB with AHSA1/START domain
VTPTTVPALVIRRTYSAAPQRVYDAWTTPAMIKEFMSSGKTVTVCAVDVDVRTGGRYRIGFDRPEGDTWYVTGEYREVSPPNRLSMTWRWEEANPADERETLLTLEFRPLDGGTELILTHEAFASEESRSAHQEGWTAMLDKVSESFA